MAAFDEALRAVGTRAVDIGKKGMDGSLLNSNKAINSLFGAPRLVGGMLKGQGFDQAAVGAGLKTGVGKEGKWNPGMIAGSFIGGSAMYRVASGGGVTRDSNGNSNLIGVPFV